MTDYRAQYRQYGMPLRTKFIWLFELPRGRERKQAYNLGYGRTYRASNTKILSNKQQERYRDLNRTDRAYHLLKRIEHDYGRSNVTLTLTDVQELLTNKSCQCCGRLLDYSAPKRHDATPSIDRVLPDLGYTKANSRMICFACNRRKQDSTIADLEQICEYIKRNTVE